MKEFDSIDWAYVRTLGPKLAEATERLNDALMECEEVFEKRLGASARGRVELERGEYKTRQKLPPDARGRPRWGPVTSTRSWQRARSKSCGPPVGEPVYDPIMLARRNLLLSLLTAPFAFLFPKKANAEYLLKGCNIIASVDTETEPPKLVTIGMQVEPGDFSTVGGGERLLDKLRDMMASHKPLIDDNYRNRISMHFLQADGKPWGRGEITIRPSLVFEKGHWRLLRTAMYMARSHGTPTTWASYSTLKYIGVTFFVTHDDYRAPGLAKFARA